MKTLFLSFKTPVPNMSISAREKQDHYTVNIYNVFTHKSKTTNLTLKDIKEKFNIIGEYKN